MNYSKKFTKIFSVLMQVIFLLMFAYQFIIIIFRDGLSVEGVLMAIFLLSMFLIGLYLYFCVARSERVFNYDFADNFSAYFSFRPVRLILFSGIGFLPFVFYDAYKNYNAGDSVEIFNFALLVLVLILLFFISVVGLFNSYFISNGGPSLHLSDQGVLISYTTLFPSPCVKSYLIKWVDIHYIEKKNIVLRGFFVGCSVNYIFYACEDDLSDRKMRKIFTRIPGNKFIFSLGDVMLSVPAHHIIHASEYFRQKYS